MPLPNRDLFLTKHVSDGPFSQTFPYSFLAWIGGLHAVELKENVWQYTFQSENVFCFGVYIIGHIWCDIVVLVCTPVAPLWR